MLNEYGNIEFSEGNVDDVTGYIMEVDPVDGKSRHKGNGQGCFWTDWE